VVPGPTQEPSVGALGERDPYRAGKMTHGRLENHPLLLKAISEHSGL